MKQKWNKERSIQGENYDIYKTPQMYARLTMSTAGIENQLLVSVFFFFVFQTNTVRLVNTGLAQHCILPIKKFTNILLGRHNQSPYICIIFPRRDGNQTLMFIVHALHDHTLPCQKYDKCMQKLILNTIWCLLLPIRIPMAWQPSFWPEWPAIIWVVWQSANAFFL